MTKTSEQKMKALKKRHERAMDKLRESYLEKVKENEDLKKYLQSMEKEVAELRDKRKPREQVIEYVHVFHDPPKKEPWWKRMWKVPPQYGR